MMMMYRKFPINTGFMFYHPDGVPGKSFDFSSDLEKIGKEWDVAIKNGTYIEIISDPVTIKRDPYGYLTLLKIKADVATDFHTIIKELWVPANCITKVE